MASEDEVVTDPAALDAMHALRWPAGGELHFTQRDTSDDCGWWRVDGEHKSIRGIGPIIRLVCVADVGPHKAGEIAGLATVMTREQNGVDAWRPARDANH